MSAGSLFLLCEEGLKLLRADFRFAQNAVLAVCSCGDCWLTEVPSLCWQELLVLCFQIRAFKRRRKGFQEVEEDVLLLLFCE